MQIFLYNLFSKFSSWNKLAYLLGTGESYGPTTQHIHKIYTAEKCK